MTADRAAARGLEYQPALDGVRALSVVAVLLFHGQVTGFGGGYLGVSVFFTLSGFLITSLMIAEHERTDRVRIGAFYVRRAKRLLPASLLCVLAIAVLAAATTLFDGVENLRRDLVGAITQVANWVFLSGNDSYQHLLARVAGQASPVEHYWSLAIEEQFYWMWPLAFVGLYKLVTTRRAATRVIAGVTVAFAIAAPVIAAVWGADAAYWATPARAAEILAGVLAAFLVHGRTLSPRWAWAAPGAIVALGVAVVLFPSDHGPAYHGALPLVGAASALLIVGLQVPGPVRVALSWSPLVWLGRISYGVYLYHWPVYVLLDHQRTGLGTPALVTLRLAVTLVLALVSFFAFERPIRLAWLQPSHVGGLALGSAVAVLVTVLVVVTPGRGAYWRTSASAAAAAIDSLPDGTLPPLVVATTVGATTTSTVPPTTATAPDGSAPDTTFGPTTSTAPTTSTTAPLPALSRPMRVLVAGDSTAEATGAGLVQWAVEHPELAKVSDASAEGCGFLRDGTYDAGGWTAYTKRCATWLDRDLPRKVASLRPDVVMLMTSSWDVLDRRWGDGPVETPFDADYRARLEADFAAVVDQLLTSGAAHVVFVREPAPVPLWGFGGKQAQSDPARHQVLGDVMANVATAHPGQVTVVDLLSWLQANGLVDDHDARPDGVHWDPPVAARIAREFLGEQLVRAAVGV